MPELLFVWYQRCSTCRKAKAWLDARGVAYVERHIVDEPPSADELTAWIARSGLATRRFFNTSGKLYRELGVKAQLDAGLTDEGAIELLASNGMLVKRPLLVGEGFVLVGFREAEWAAALGEGAGAAAAAGAGIGEAAGTAAGAAR